MTPEQLAQLLGRDVTELVRAGEQQLPRDGTARGYAAEPLERVAQRLDQEGDVVDVLPAHGGVVQHLQWALGTYFAAPANDREHLEVVSGRSLELGDGELLVSGREGPAVVRVLTAGAPTRVYVLEHGRAELWSIAPEASEAEPLETTVPELEAWTGGVAGPEELEAEFRELRGSASVLDRLAAPGLLLRFWVPRERSARQQLLATLALGDAPLLVAVRSWYLALPEAARHAACRLALTEVEAVRQQLAELAASDGAQEHDLATAAALRRDRLESMRRVLQSAGEGDSLAVALRGLDDRAAVHLTQLADAGVADDRLRRVLEAEPDAWWGVISG